MLLVWKSHYGNTTPRNPNCDCFLEFTVHSCCPPSMPQLFPWNMGSHLATKTHGSSHKFSLFSRNVCGELTPTSFIHYIYLRRFVPSPFFALSETCCFRMLSSSAFRSLPGQAQMRASKQRLPRTCPLGNKRREDTELSWRNLKGHLDFSPVYFYSWPFPPAHPCILGGCIKNYLAEHKSAYMPQATLENNIPFVLQRTSKPLAEQLYLATYFEGNLS